MAIQTVPEAPPEQISERVEMPSTRIQQKLAPIVWEASKLQSMLKVTTGSPGEAFRAMGATDQEQFMESCADKLQAVIDLLIELSESSEGRA